MINSSNSDNSTETIKDKNISTLDRVDNKFSKSGTIVVSFPIFKDSLGNISTNIVNNEQEIISKKDLNEENFLTNNTKNNQETYLNSAKNPSNNYAPLVGFIPVHATFQPADNEVWIELERNSSLIKVYKGKEKIKEIKAQGRVTLAPGEYPLQHKQKSPLWYATDEYFEKRQLKIPPRGDHFRYRRGALGTYALYPTMEFIIHSGPFWSEEIGGLQISDLDLAAIFMMINIGSPIVIK